MKFVTPLYIGEQATQMKGTIIRGLKEGRAPFGSYVLALPLNDNDQLDILPAGMLSLPYFKDKTITIVGIAFGKSDAVKLVAYIVSEAIKQIGKADILEFLKERQRKQDKA